MIEEIYQTKKQIRVYDEDHIPDANLINSIIEKAYNLVPSKQNLVPYKIHVLGPECKEEKKYLYDLTTHTGAKVKHNRAVFAPYVLIFTNRIVNDTNEAVLERFEKGHPLQGVCDPNKFMDKGPLIQTSIEIGMYSSILAGLCLENKLGISFLKCFKSWFGVNSDRGDWIKLPFVRCSPLLIMCIGYKHEQRDWNLDHEKEYKPDINNIINHL